MKTITPTNKTIITEWVEKYADQLFNYAFNRTNQEEIAKDLVQETFLSAFEGVNNFKNNSQAKTWLFSILRNKIAQYFRIQYKKEEVSLSQLTENNFTKEGEWVDQNQKKWGETPELSEDEDFKKVVNFCLSNLPKSWQTIVKSKFFDLKNGKEICNEFELTEVNYWQLIHRSKLKLRKCLTVNWFNKQ